MFEPRDPLCDLVPAPYYAVYRIRAGRVYSPDESVAKYIAFLRGLNIGGHRIKMTDLCAHFESLGFARAESFIASGNIVFETRSANPAAMERKIESHLRASLGYDVATFIRSLPEVIAISKYKPFKDGVLKSARVLNVGFLPEPPGAAAIAALMKHRSAGDDFHLNGREVYWACKTGQSESAFFKVGFEKVFKCRVTVRNVNTITRVAGLHAPGGK